MTAPHELVLPAIADVEAARDRIAGIAVRTPLIENTILSERVGGRVFVKCETLQRTGSFKFRGAYNAIAALAPEVRKAGIVAVSSGNHAQGVAEAARLFGVPATIVMPSDAPAIKKARTRRSGALIVDYDRATEDRDAVVADLIARNGGTLVHPFNNFQVISGQGTIGLEIREQMAEAGAVPSQALVPCGGGGLSAGVALALKAGFPGIAVHPVEPEGFDDYGRSLRAGTILANAQTGGSLCDALLTPQPGTLTFALNRVNLAEPYTVSDAEALAAVAFAFEELKLVVEPGGAVALAALLSGKLKLDGATAVIVLSGGNIDAPVLAQALGLA